MKRVMAAITAALLAITAPAFIGNSALAADMAIKTTPARMSPQVPNYNWTGCYAGAGIGYGMADINHSTTDASGVTFDAGHDNSAKGWLGVLGSGCDLQIYPRWVVGVTADFEFSDSKGQYSFNCPATAGCVVSGYSGQIKGPWAWGVGGRAGYLVGPSLLTYWTGGFTQARFDQVNYSDAQTGATTGLVLPAQTYDGWYLGGGIEFALGDFVPGLYWRTEYRFSDYQTRNVSQPCGGGLCGVSGTLHSIDRVHPQEQSIWTAVVYRFNWTGLRY
jgi:outer membrane immunogenic protein